MALLISHGTVMDTRSKNVEIIKYLTQVKLLKLFLNVTAWQPFHLKYRHLLCHFRKVKNKSTNGWSVPGRLLVSHFNEKNICLEIINSIL